MHALRHNISSLQLPGLALLLCLLSCKNQPASPEATTAFNSIIPKPVSAEATGNAFYVTRETKIVIDSSGGEVAALAEYLSGKLRMATGFALPVEIGTSAEGAIFLTTAGEAAWGTEGYRLTVDNNRVTLAANTGAGLFMGIQTLRQLLPAAIEETTAQQVEWPMATGTITDYPQYAWRGAMLDVARHFFTVEDVKRYIDLVSFYKINTLHLHLSDDQGWRIEIKSWPNLTTVGGSTQVGGGKGGYYTQNEYADIVAYAKSRYITIIPEIDLPGHINAALASYAELNAGPPVKREAGPVSPVQPNQEVKPKPVAGQLYTGIEVGFSTLHMHKPETFRFVEDVLRELAAITPGPYLHIGGDEAAVTKKPDYIAFINRFKDIVKANGKRMIGWEEIAQADLDSSIVVQYWNAESYARQAAEKGASIIFSPAKKAYLDMQYDSTTKLGLHWAAYIEADSAYLWNPATRVEGIEKDQILGVEAPLWSETIVTMDDLEYMVFPRLPGIAEIGWSPAADRSWDEYKVRVGNQSKRWKAMGIDFYRSPKIPWAE
jgi:hexosaminidase